MSALLALMAAGAMLKSAREDGGHCWRARRDIDDAAITFMPLIY